MLPPVVEALPSPLPVAAAAAAERGGGIEMTEAPVGSEGQGCWGEAADLPLPSTTPVRAAGRRGEQLTLSLSLLYPSLSSFRSSRLW